MGGGTSISPRVGPSEQIDLERYEAKYIVHREMIPAIREFIKPFCTPDPNAPGEIPEYIVTTLQLDTPDMALYRAKEEEALHRFKLRVRTYGLDGRCPVFMEIKRKIKGVIAKSRAIVPFESWGEGLCRTPPGRMTFHTPSQEQNFLEFVRVVAELGARPRVLIRYHRESYLGMNDQYARVTLDRRLCYRGTTSWDLLPPGGRWWSMDSALAMGGSFSGVILELKTFGDAPVWMVDMTERFNLVRVGFSKYFNAVRLDSLFEGGEYSMDSENCAWH